MKGYNKSDGRYKVESLSIILENVYLILFSTKISVRIYKKGWQISCHLISVNNAKDLSIENT